mmetsp:Transcript_15322/g.27895  ORF Transcript_15322/g.27895 Transcript_15322/m.27895 type:complete len:369 (-) Transcript_15322:359-1465(-)
MALPCKNLRLVLVCGFVLLFFLYLYVTEKENMRLSMSTHSNYKWTSSSYPGRFMRDSYPNMSIAVNFTKHANASPYSTTDCASGLICSFSDKTWHEKTWNQNIITFPDSPKLPNTVYISRESPSRGRSHVLDSKGKHAGLAIMDLRSDIPVSILPETSEVNAATMRTGRVGIESIHEPMSSEIFIWRILHVASNCESVTSGRNRWIEALIKRGLVDSFGHCHHNKDWKSVEHLIPLATSVKVPHGSNSKLLLMRKYAFVTAFENSYYPGYATEKLVDPLRLGTLPIYLGAPNVNRLFPEKSFINADDFATHNDLADYIEFLITNKEEYYQYHAWRENDISTEVQEIWEFAKQPENCRFCRWAAENLYL